MKNNSLRPQRAIGFLTIPNHSLLVLLALCGLLFLGLSACRTIAPPHWLWQRAEAGLPRQAIVLAVAIDPVDPNRLWVGYYAPNGLATSHDGGQTWTLGAEGLGDNPVFDLLALLPDSSISQTELWAATRDGVYQSLDSGTSWQPVAHGLPAIAAFALASDASGRVYVGLDGAGIYVEAANNRGWQSLTPSVSRPTAGNKANGQEPAAVLSLAVSLDGQQIYAGTPGSGIYVSQDGGQSWINTYHGEYVPEVALNPADPAKAIASLRHRLVRTHDGGQSWHTVPVSWTTDEIVSLLWLADGTFGAGTGQGQVYRSLDGGNSWAEVGAGLSSSGGVMVLAVAGERSFDHPHRILAGTWTGVYASDDGQAWTRLAPPLGIPHARTLLTTENGLLLGTRAGLFRWQADSHRWTPTADELPGGVASLASAPSDNQIIYAGTTGDGVYRSNDLGASWQRVPSLGVGVPALAVDPGNPEHAYMLAIWERVYETHDGGQQWQARWDGLGVTTEAASLTVDPMERIAYVGAGTGLYRSRNGETWQLVAPTLADQSVLTLMTQLIPEASGGGTVLYLGTTRGIYRSLDEGETVQYSETDRGWGRGLEDTSVTAMLADPNDPQRLYVGTAYAGVYQSVDWGHTWESIGPSDLTADVVEALGWGPEGELFAVAAGGVWRGIKQ